MNFITDHEFEERFEYTEGSGLYNNPEFKFLIDDCERCFYLPKNFSHDVLTDFNVDWFMHRNISFRRVLDVGAGIGDDAASLSEISDVIESWEIGDLAFSCLSANLEIAAGTYAKNTLFNKYQCAITNSNDYSIEVAEYVDAPNNNGVAHIGNLTGDREYLLEQPDNYVLVKQKTLDSYNFQDVDFIKVDVNGFELQVLEGAIETIKSNNPYIYVNLDEAKMSVYNTTPNQVNKLLLSLGYKNVTDNIYFSK